MTSGRSANRLARTALAIIFGAMSLFHGTVMTFAKPSASFATPVQHVESVMHMPGDIGAHHHHAAHGQQQSVPTMPDAAPSCYGVGCFVAMQSLAVTPSTVSVQTIAILSPSIGKAMLSTIVDPLVPPPRIQV